MIFLVGECQALLNPIYQSMGYTVQEMMSLVLPNLTTITTHHLQMANLLCLELLLEHPSVQDLQLLDKGQNVTLLWLFAQRCDPSKARLNVLIDRAKLRGESVRERCGPEGNLVEMLLKQRPSMEGRAKLLLLREHYQSMAWPFEYDLSEVERTWSDYWADWGVAETGC